MADNNWPPYGYNYNPQSYQQPQHPPVQPQYQPDWNYPQGQPTHSYPQPVQGYQHVPQPQIPVSHIQPQHIQPQLVPQSSHRLNLVLNPSETRPAPRGPPSHPPQAHYSSTQESMTHTQPAANPYDSPETVAPANLTVSSRGRARKVQSYKEEPIADDNGVALPPPPKPKAPKKRKNVIDDDDDEDFQDDGDDYDEDAGPSTGGSGRAGRNRRGAPAAPSAIKDEDGDYEEDEEETVTRHGRTVRRRIALVESDDEEDSPKKPSRITKRRNDDFIVDEDDEEDIADHPDEDYGSKTLTRAERAALLAEKAEKAKQERKIAAKYGARTSRNSRKRDSDFELSSDAGSDDIGSLPPLGDDSDDYGGEEGKSYRLRQRKSIEYNEIARFDKLEQNGILGGPTVPSKPRDRDRKKNKMNFSMTGADYERAWGPLKTHLSDSDSDAGRTPKKPALPGGLPGNMLAGGVNMPLDLAGTPSNLGKLGDASLADTDPLGTNQNISFEDVGGLEDHISKLKEMTLLPLLYPDMFQALGVQPPRGVLFHGPPGTGKTLVARALAAECRSGGRSVSFFMRKGADVLSKWVGEAERQLRLLFEEAKNQQPSIIFFDEIDGLAPVRSSKQDQIHASIVSTLLALMDGMDGRGQVIVIGATNRPDAIDPALRRPGRFDREFYFPLPNFNARVKILEIHTKKWDNWTGEKGEDSRKKLAKMTKGYGGADLRSLCTEAALNAIQRQYPQIYTSADRLLLDHSKIVVQARDFMVSVQKIVPSSARSSSSLANPLPQQLEALLDAPLTRVKDALDKMLPKSKKRSALEEAQWEEDDEAGETGAFDREMLLQALESQRINRPRMLLYGAGGMGQRIVASAALHHLEGYHVQPFDLSTLTSDSTRTAEAAITQLFVEAKRHSPSIIFIPSLTAWCSGLSETCRTLFADSLESLDPTDPILLLAVLHGTPKVLPKDVRKWFGHADVGRTSFGGPEPTQREQFFLPLIEYISKPPSDFPDAVKRKRRVLEVLPIAPPLPPREPSAAEKAAQHRLDMLTLNRLKIHLNNINQALIRKEKSFTKAKLKQMFKITKDEHGQVWGAPQRRLAQPATPLVAEAPAAMGDPFIADPQTAVVPAAAPAEEEIFRHKLVNIDMPRIASGIWEGAFLTSEEFLAAIRTVYENAEKERYGEGEQSEQWYQRAARVYTFAQQEVAQTDPTFDLECRRMAERLHKARKLEEEKAREEAEAAEKAEKEKLEAEKQAEAPTEPANDVSMDAGDGEHANGELNLRKRLREDGEGSETSDRPFKRIKPVEEGVEATKTVRFDPVVDIAPEIVVNGHDTDMKSPASPSPNRDAQSLVIAENTAHAPDGLTQTLPRSPSPMIATPQEFIISPDLLDALKKKLVSKTPSLDVEQLEALRASCLDIVWRHRSEWNRDGLVSDISTRIDQYLEEIGEDGSDDE